MESKIAMASDMAVNINQQVNVLFFKYLQNVTVDLLCQTIYGSSKPFLSVERQHLLKNAKKVCKLLQVAKQRRDQK